MTLDEIVSAFATPVLGYTTVLDRAAARARIESLHAARTANGVLAQLKWYATTGQRQEWTYYDYYAARGQLTSDPRDHTRLRKITFPNTHRPRLGTRGLVALDAMRACALARWSVTAELLGQAEAHAAVLPIVLLALRTHASWADFREQVLLGLEFSEGEVDAALRTQVESLDGAWPSEPAATTRETDEETALRFFALRLTVDCPSCELAISLSAIATQVKCRFCGTDVALTPEEWGNLFAGDIGQLRGGAEDFAPITNDFGARFFSRRKTTEVASVACACGTALRISEPGTVRCECGRGVHVRAADDVARAIDEQARLVAEPVAKTIDRQASFACAACGVAQLLGAEPSRVRVCVACQERTYVDDLALARSFEPPRRPTVYLAVPSRVVAL